MTATFPAYSRADWADEREVATSRVLPTGFSAAASLANHRRLATDQLTHCLQTATLAEEAGADAELIVASLCHDIGKAVSVRNHGAIGAEILKPYVRPDLVWMLQVHQDFQGRHYYHYFGEDRNKRDQYVDHPAYEVTARFCDEWDQVAFDPDRPTKPLEHFEPLVPSGAQPRY